MKICSESFKEGYKEEFMAQLRKMVYGDQGITTNFINYIINHMGRVEGSCEHGNETPGSIKLWEVLEWLHNWWLFKECSALW
jgi:hypothetical protein